MHPSSLLSVLTLGLYSLSLIQAAGNSRSSRRNRLRSFIPDKNSTTVAEEKSELESVAQTAVTETEPTRFEALVNVATSVSAASSSIDEPQSQAEENKVQESEEDIIEVSSVNVPKISLEDQRAAIFEALYLEYEKILGRYCHSGMIEWERVNVLGWPEYIDKSDLNNWSESDVEILSYLVGSNLITFKPVSRGKKDHAKPLLAPIKQYLSPVIQQQEEISNVEGEEKETAMVQASESDSSSDSDLKSLSDSEKESTVTAVNKAPAAATKSKSKRKIGKMSNFKSIKVESNLPVNEEKKAAVLGEVLKIYRRHTGKFVAEEIDWKLAKVFHLQNHLLPFSTDFKTEGDVLTLEALMKRKNFGFYDVSSIQHRRFMIYERLYKLYSKVPGLVSVDPFFVKWCQVNVKGWPKGLGLSYNSWKLKDLIELERLLDAGQIILTSKNAKKAAKKKYTRKYDSSSDEESYEYESESSSESESSMEQSDESSSSEEEFVIRAKRKRNAKRAEIKSKEEEGKSNKIHRMIVEIPDEPTTLVADEQVKEPKSVEEIEQVENLKTELAGVLENLLAAKEKFSQSPRHQRIIGEIMKCFKLLQIHANDENPAIPAAEILDFLEIFQRALSAISPDGELNQINLKEFVFNAIKLRARLAGIEYIREKGKLVFRIPGNRIADPGLYGFLKRPENRWVDELPLLEFALDNDDDNSIFA